MHKGELKLYRAVMLQAAQDIADSSLLSSLDSSGMPRVPNVQSHFSALQWLADDADYPFSFCDCCYALGLDPHRARQSLSRLARFGLCGRQAVFSAALEGWA